MRIAPAAIVFFCAILVVGLVHKTNAQPDNSTQRAILSPETVELDGKKLQLLFADGFEDGQSRWSTTDDSSWDLKSGLGNATFGLNRRKSDYDPKYRSPHNIALIDNLDCDDFVMTFRVRSTKDTGNHRDCCVFFSYQNPDQFYYAHLGAKPDPASGQIMIVDRHPRRPLTENKKPVPWSNQWHSVKVTRNATSGKTEVYFDDMNTPLMSAVDKTFGAGQIGIGSFDDMNDFDDIRVYGPANTTSKTNLAAKPAGPNANARIELRDNERIVFVGSSLAERMNLFGHLETTMHVHFPGKKLVVRNFGWPADEVGRQQRPENYTRIDNPLEEFGPELFLCFFGFNEHFAGDDAEQIKQFNEKYRQWISEYKKKYTKPSRPARFVLMSPIAFESTGDPHLPDGKANNIVLQKYTAAICMLADELQLPFVDLFTPTLQKFNSDAGAQFTINGVHVNEMGDRFVAGLVTNALFGHTKQQPDFESNQLKRLRSAVNDKSWFHLQDYRMLNGWYVYGGRRTWDKQTFPGEYQKIRKMVSVRDQYVWDIVAGRKVPDVPDDSNTGEVFIPETMFGTRDNNFRSMREPKTLDYPTPESSIDQMTVPEGFEVQLFASEREFPELANPTQIAFDNKGRLWVSCMINYPQWLPGAAKPGDSLLIFEDTDGDGKADVCKTFYDRLICPTGFEFHDDGVLVIDEPRILFLRDTDGNDQADEVTRVLDGIATDDTHHAMGAWEWSHGGLLYMLEGISMSTTIETPWGPVRNKGPSGGYILDPRSWKFRYFKTPGYGNPWCMVFDRWGMGIVGDGTNARQHWTSPLSGYPVASRKTLRPNFDNQNMRPAVGSDFLLSRHFPDEVQGQFIYACVINMHGIPRFNMGDEPGTAGFTGKRIEDLIVSSDNFFRPVDPKIGPDGALWFGDWCNALIGHMQYSQRDPNRDHEHGRIYRLVHTARPLNAPELQHEKNIDQLLEQLGSYELRTRYRARRELRGREKAQVLSAVDNWISRDVSAERLCEALWLQESFRAVDPQLVDRILQSDNFHARAAAIHTVANEIERFEDANSIFVRAIQDEHPRVRLEAVRGLSFVQTAASIENALRVLDKPLDYWIEYTLEHTLQALQPHAEAAKQAGTFLNNSTERAKTYYEDFVLSNLPGGKAVGPLKVAQDGDAPQRKREQAVSELAKLDGGDAKRGATVFERVCSACHKLHGEGKEFGPALDGVASRYNRMDIIKHILWPNDEITKGYETVQVLTLEGRVLNGFILEENEKTLSLGVATDDGKGARVDLAQDDIEDRKDMKASSMPEGLVKTIAPSEFLDLIEFLGDQFADEDGWISTLKSDRPARKRGGFVEISRDAQIRLSGNFPKQWNRKVHLTLSPKSTGNQGFAFHSPEPPIEHPHVIVRLVEPAEVRHVFLKNRAQKQFHNRAKGLAVWLSSDGENWDKVWQETGPAAVYNVEVPAGTVAKYVKVGLEKKGIFHLDKIAIFGEE